MKKLPILASILCFFTIFSCIPLRIAPKIETDKVVVGKKFKRQLPKKFAFVFEDPKNADEFYNYIDTKYQLNNLDVEYNVPFSIDGEQFFFSFYETEIPTKIINLLPMFIDGVLDNEGYEPILEDHHYYRNGNWYIAVTVSNVNLEDCLSPDYKSRDKVLKYLRKMRVEYLTTHNYVEAFFRK